MRVLGEAAEADFEATVAWLAAHPERVVREELIGMAQSVTTRLNADPAAFLDARAADGSLPIIIDAIGNALLNQAAGQCPKIWDWPSDQPDGPGVSSLNETVLQSAARKDPEAYLEMARLLSATGDYKLLEVVEVKGGAGGCCQF